MDLVARAAIIYVFYLVVFRITGKRTLAQATPFDLVLLLVISEAIQNALTRGDHSITSAFVVVLTLVSLDIGLSLLKQHFKPLDRLLDDMPLVLLMNGRALHNRMRRARVDEEDILEAARSLQGLERLEQIKYAVLERNGTISIIPK